MNILPLLLIGLLMGGEKFSSLKDTLLKIDFASFSPILQLIGVDKKTVDFLSSEEFEKTLSSGDLKSLLPVVTSLFSKPTTEKEELDSPEQKPCDYLAPIKNVAPTDVGATIESFLAV